MWDYLIDPAMRLVLIILTGAALLAILAFALAGVRNLFGILSDNPNARRITAIFVLIATIYGLFVVGTAIYDHYYPIEDAPVDIFAPQ